MQATCTRPHGSTSRPIEWPTLAGDRDRQESTATSTCPDRGARTRHNGCVAWEIPYRRTESGHSALRHVLVAGGSVAQWEEFSDEQWRTRLDDLVTIASRSGARFVTVHPHDLASHASDDRIDRSALGSLRRVVEQDGVRVQVDPVVDGRQRIVDVVSSWPTRRRVTEKKLSAALFGKAGEPDLVIVLGPRDRLPASLVWELAYGELVFVDVPWSELGPQHLEAAVDDYAGRQRRFGGVE